MAPVSLIGRYLYHKDVEVLARAARVPFAAVGSVSPSPLGTIRIRIGAGQPIPESGPPVPVSEIVRLVRRLAATPEISRQDRIDQEIRLEAVEGSQQVVAWLETDRCVVVALYPLIGSTPFVALLGASGSSGFARWQKELARLALMQESQGASRSAAVGAVSEDDVLSSVLDRLTIPIALVDRTAKVVYRNAAAHRSFMAPGGLVLSAGQVVSTQDPDSQKRLCLAIRAATSGLARKAQLILLPGDPTGAQGRPQMVAVSPVTAARGLAVLTTSDDQQDPDMLALVFSELGLTPTEQRLACRLVLGDSLEEAAEHIGVKLSTARSYLRNIFDKTGASRQSELVSLALTLALPTSLAEIMSVDLVAASRATILPRPPPAGPRRPGQLERTS